MKTDIETERNKVHKLRLKIHSQCTYVASLLCVCAYEPPACTGLWKASVLESILASDTQTPSFLHGCAHCWCAVTWNRSIKVFPSRYLSVKNKAVFLCLSIMLDCVLHERAGLACQIPCCSSPSDSWFHRWPLVQASRHPCPSHLCHPVDPGEDPEETHRFKPEV